MLRRDPLTAEDLERNRRRPMIGEVPLDEDHLKRYGMHVQGEVCIDTAATNLGRANLDGLVQRLTALANDARNSAVEQLERRRATHIGKSTSTYRYR
jgi:hypothetical protein